jgi:hypothetical protein
VDYRRLLFHAAFEQLKADSITTITIAVNSWGDKYRKIPRQRGIAFRIHIESGGDAS